MEALCIILGMTVGSALAEFYWGPWAHLAIVASLTLYACWRIIDSGLSKERQ